ncbi:MAG: hypothetical protein JRE23_12110, partial [Deltaproteobacteria bacterium]|nr:hypothetical protein [Deltaproteobacteria bacterium]
ILVYKESQVEKKVAEYIKLCLNDIGIRVGLQALAFAEIKERYLRNNQFQAVITELDTPHRKPEYLQHIWSSHRSKRSIAGCFEHSEVTRLIRRAFDEKEPLKQKELFYEIDTLLTSLQPGTFLFQKSAIDVMSKRFTLPSPFSLKHDGIYRLKYASLNIN